MQINPSIDDITLFGIIQFLLPEYNSREFQSLTSKKSGTLHVYTEWWTCAPYFMVGHTKKDGIDQLI